VTYAGAAVGIGIWGELRSSEDRERVGSSKTVDITDHVGRGAGSALLSRTPRDHVRWMGIAASEGQSQGRAQGIDETSRVGTANTNHESSFLLV
jgi:hypothetical protein